MGKKATAKREALGKNYIGRHGQELPARASRRHNKERLDRLNEQFRKAGLPLASTLTQAEKQRKRLGKAPEPEKQQEKKPEKRVPIEVASTTPQFDTEFERADYERTQAKRAGDKLKEQKPLSKYARKQQERREAA